MFIKILSRAFSVMLVSVHVIGMDNLLAMQLRGRKIQESEQNSTKKHPRNLDNPTNEPQSKRPRTSEVDELSSELPKPNRPGRKRKRVSNDIQQPQSNRFTPVEELRLNEAEVPVLDLSATPPLPIQPIVSEPRAESGTTVDTQATQPDDFDFDYYLLNLGRIQREKRSREQAARKRRLEADEQKQHEDALRIQREALELKKQEEVLRLQREANERQQQEEDLRNHHDQLKLQKEAADHEQPEQLRIHQQQEAAVQEEQDEHTRQEIAKRQEELAQEDNTAHKDIAPAPEQQQEHQQSPKVANEKFELIPSNTLEGKEPLVDEMEIDDAQGFQSKITYDREEPTRENWIDLGIEKLAHHFRIENNPREFVFHPQLGIKIAHLDYLSTSMYSRNKFSCGDNIVIFSCNHALSMNDYQEYSEGWKKRGLKASCLVCNKEIDEKSLQLFNAPALTAENFSDFFDFLRHDVPAAFREEVFIKCTCLETSSSSSRLEQIADAIKNKNDAYAEILLEQEMTEYLQQRKSLKPLIALGLQGNLNDELIFKMINLEPNSYLPYQNTTLLMMAIQQDKSQFIKYLLAKCHDPLSYCATNRDEQKNAFDLAIETRSNKSFDSLKILVEITQPNTEIFIKLLKKCIPTEQEEKSIFLAEKLCIEDSSEKALIWNELLMPLFSSSNSVQLDVAKILLQKMGSLDDAKIIKALGLTCSNLSSHLIEKLTNSQDIIRHEYLHLILQHRIMVNHNTLNQFLKLMGKLNSISMVFDEHNAIECIKLLIDYGCNADEAQPEFLDQNNGFQLNPLKLFAGRTKEAQQSFKDNAILTLQQHVARERTYAVDAIRTKSIRRPIHQTTPAASSFCTVM